MAPDVYDGIQFKESKSHLSKLLHSYPLGIGECEERVEDLYAVLKNSFDDYRYEDSVQATFAPNVTIDPLRLFMALADSLQGHRFDEANPIWGHLGALYFLISLKTVRDIEDWRVVQNHLFVELEHVFENQQTTYGWFTLWCDRLSILMTPPVDRQKRPKNFNTHFYAYKKALADYTEGGHTAWWCHELYLSGVQRTGNYFLRECASPWALARDLYPDVVMLPYPYALSAQDIVKTLPRPEGSHFWPLGFVFDRVYADGDKMPPMYFYTHDQNHLGIYRWMLMGADRLYFQEQLTQSHILKEWQSLDERKNLLFEALAKAQEVVDTSVGDQKKIFAFFALYVFHEHANHGLRRLSLMAHGGQRVFGNLKTKDTVYGPLFNDKYYLSLMPLEIELLKNMPDKFLQALSDAWDLFITKLGMQERIQTFVHGFMDAHPQTNSVFVTYLEMAQVPDFVVAEVQNNHWKVGRNEGESLDFELNFSKMHQDLFHKEMTVDYLAQVYFVHSIFQKGWGHIKYVVREGALYPTTPVLSQELD